MPPIQRVQSSAAKAGLKVAVIGGGWAGLAAAVKATQLGHNVTVYEATRTLGGRARSLEVNAPDGNALLLDNGQHILIGAYRRTLLLMRQIGVPLARHLQTMPLTLVRADGTGLAVPPVAAWVQRFAPGFDVALGILQAKGWTLGDRLSLLRHALVWRLRGFRCAPQVTVHQLCRHLAPRVVADLIEPLCVSALNTPYELASAEVFLRVLREALFSPKPAALPYPPSTLLLPRTDLGQLFPKAAERWLLLRGARIVMGKRVEVIEPLSNLVTGPVDKLVAWDVHGERYDRVIIACPPSEATRMIKHSTFAVFHRARDWLQKAQRLQFQAITTVYAQAAPQTRLMHPMLALRSGPGAPAQFVFDKGQLGGPPGLLAFVVSASIGERDQIEADVQAQAIDELGIGLHDTVQTVVEKRATFACTPDLPRPPMRIGDGIFAAGDYIEGPYPATLEGAVRSGLAAARAL